jgi:hypothetical protein
MSSEDEDVVSADGAKLAVGRTIGRWDDRTMASEQYDNETMKQCHNGTTGARNHGQWDTGTMDLRTNEQDDNRTTGQWTIRQWTLAQKTQWVTGTMERSRVPGQWSTGQCGGETMGQ